MDAPTKLAENASEKEVEDIGGRDALEFWADLVRIHPVNLEDPAGNRRDKSRYPEAARRIVQQARAWGLGARLWDAREELPGGHRRFAEPRPNVIVEVDRGAPDTLAILAHYDVVPVPEEQRKRWRSDPTVLTRREDGRYYGRGSNDDLGSGVVGGLVALRDLSRREDLPCNVRWIGCCDEETGGEGGIEALRAHDRSLPPGSPESLITAEFVLIPDGAPYVAAGSSGVSFVDVVWSELEPLGKVGELLQGLLAFHRQTRQWRSELPAPPEPGTTRAGPPLPGRATITKMDLEAEGNPGTHVRLRAAHAHSEAANQIPALVTLKFDGPPGGLEGWAERLRLRPLPPLHDLEFETFGENELEVRVEGVSGHGGYPHRAANPILPAVALLEWGVLTRMLDPLAPVRGRVTVDLRSPPEMDWKEAVGALVGYWDRIRTLVPSARLRAPASRCRSGYRVPAEERQIERFRQIFSRTQNGPVGIYAEYGGTDASALRGLRTPRGRPLPALVFGSMDETAHIHDAEESALPALVGAVRRALVEFVSSWIPP